MDKSTRLSGYIYGLHLEGGPIRYIGLTQKSISTRFSQHKYNARAGLRYPLYDWMRKYAGQVQVSLLEEVPDGHAEGLEAREVFHISEARKMHGSKLLNLSSGGSATMKGGTLSAEARAKISASRMGKPLSDEHRASISASLIGNTRSLGYSITEEHRANLSAAQTGRKHTDETKLRMSQSQLGRTHTSETLAKLSIAASNRSPEHQARIVESLTGRKLTAEHRQKIAAAGIGRPGNNKLANHTRWHVNRNSFNPECVFCANPTD